MRYWNYACISLLTLLTLGWNIMAQEETSCPAIIDSALRLVDELCTSTERNQACYGNLSLTVEPHVGIEAFKFDTPGDIINVIDIQSIHVAPMNENVPEWGVSLMRLQANLPDTLPGQNATVLLFGNVEIDSANSISLTVDDAEIRKGPSTDYEIINDFTDTIQIADGRSEDWEWLRLQPCPDGQTCWVHTSQVEVEGDIDILPVVDLDSPSYGPLQAFTLRTGVGDAACREAPDSGILIQTPKGVGQITFKINEVSISLASTIYIQAQANKTLDIYVVEGEAEVSSFDETQVVSAGMVTYVPLDNDLKASGPPEEATVYDLSGLQSLPTNLLPDGAEIFSPPVAETADCIVSASGTVNLRTGPGTVYERTGALTMGDTANPIGQAEGTDGYIWWQLPNQTWVRSDVITTGGNCDMLPIIMELPPVPTPVPVSSGGGGTLNFNASQCPYQSGVVYNLIADRPYIISTWPGCWVDPNDAEAAKPEVSIFITVDGVPTGTFVGFGRIGSCGAADGGHNFLAKFQIPPLSAGSHIIEVTVSHPGGRVMSPANTLDGYTHVETCNVIAK